METVEDQGLIQIRFITKQEQYAVPDVPYSVPLTIDSATLNNLLNLLRQENDDNTHETLEFEFIIHTKLLRTPLNEHLADRNISTEATVDVEYIVKNPSPEPQDCLLHDDWVSAVAIKGKWILSGCYDNTIHLWSTAGAHKLVMPGHTGPVKAVTWAHLDEQSGVFISGSHDQTAILWHYKVQDNAVECVTVLRGHERGIECIRANAKGSNVVSAGWDALVKIWAASVDDMSTGDDEPSSKRAKTDSTKIRVPLLTLQGHREAVNGIAWVDDNTISTASWDHTIRLWDIELGGVKQEIVGNKAFFDVDYSPLSQMLITGSADRHVRLYDVRSNEGSVVKGTFTSHTQWVQTVRWSDTDEHLFVSGSHDNTLKQWDIRSNKAPLYDLSGHEDKLLCCDWVQNLIVSGGTDNTLRIFKQSNIIKK